MSATPCLTCGGCIGPPLPALVEARARFGMPNVPAKRCPLCVVRSLRAFADAPDGPDASAEPLPIWLPPRSRRPLWEAWASDAGESSVTGRPRSESISSAWFRLFRAPYVAEERVAMFLLGGLESFRLYAGGRVAALSADRTAIYQVRPEFSTAIAMTRRPST